MEDITIAIGHTKNHLMFYFGLVSKESKCIPSTLSLGVEIVLRLQIALAVTFSTLFLFLAWMAGAAVAGCVGGGGLLRTSARTFYGESSKLKNRFVWGSFLWTDRLVKL